MRSPGRTSLLIPPMPPDVRWSLQIRRRQDVVPVRALSSAFFCRCDRRHRGRALHSASFLVLVDLEVTTSHPALIQAWSDVPS